MSSWSCATAARRAREEEDAELELPPLDGALDERDAHEDHGDDADLDELEGGDDSVASELDAGVELDIVDEGPITDSEAAPDAMDLGALADELSLLDDGAVAADDQGLARDEEDDSPFDADANDEAGAGTSEDPSAFIDETALPPLDADEPERTPNAAPLAAIETGRRWDRGRWHVAEGVGANVPCWLVAVSSADVVAAGPTVMVVRDGARVSRSADPDIDAVAVAAADSAVFAASRRGTLYVTVDRGESWASVTAPWAGALTAPAPALAATPGRLWVCEGGALWSVRRGESDHPEPPVQVRGEGVRAMTAAGSTLIILAERGDDLVIERLRGDDEAPPAEVVPAATRALIDGAPAPLLLAAAAGGRALAILAGPSLLVSRDAGCTYRAHRIDNALAAAFAGSTADAVLLAVASARSARGRDGELLLSEVTATGPVIVSEVGASSHLTHASLAWDPARDVMWLASAAGLIAFERSARH